MSILNLQILPYVETITQEEYNHHKILCIRVERWWSDGTLMDVTKLGFVSFNRVDNKIRPKIGNELIEEHFERAKTKPLVEYFGLSTDKSDTDLIAIVEDTPKEIMTGQPLSKQMVFENEDNHFDVKMYGVTQVWRMIRKGNPNFIETFMEQPLAINEADPFMLTLDESQTIAKILHYNLPQFFKSCLGMANWALKRKNATIKNYLQTIKNLKYAQYMLTFPGTGKLNPNVGDSAIIGALTFMNAKVHQDVPKIKEYFNDVLPKEINHLVAEIEGQIPKKAEGSDKLDKLFYNKVSQELIKPY